MQLFLLHRLRNSLGRQVASWFLQMALCSHQKRFWFLFWFLGWFGRSLHSLSVRIFRFSRWRTACEKLDRNIRNVCLHEGMIFDITPRYLTMGCLHPINSMHANSPGYDNNLPVSRIGHQISRIKSSYELFCALIWNLSHFLPTFSPKIRILFDSKFVFWGIFARISSLTKISLRLPS